MEAVSDNLMESERMWSSTSESSWFENENENERGRAEAEKKMKKLRSIKLSRVASRRKGRSSSTYMLSGYAASSEHEQSTPIEMSDESSNHVNATKDESFQVFPTTKSSIKHKKSSDLKKKKPKKSGSIKPAASIQNSKSAKREVNSNDDHDIDSSSFDSSDKPVRVLRTSTLGPKRVLAKMASLKSKRPPSAKKCSSFSDQSVERATCSSTLKDSKFPDRIESESDGTTAAALNVCRYSYCSLHGHQHTNKPPLKRFISMRRRVAKTHKGLKPDPLSSGNSNRKKGAKRVVAVKQTTPDTTEISSALDVDEDIASSLNIETEYEGNSRKDVRDLETISTQGSEEKNEGFRSANVGNQSNLTFWKFIYKHMVTGLDVEAETQRSAARVDSVEHVEDQSCLEISRTDQDKTIQDHEASDRKLELSQSDAIKLVQQAFDKILSEIPDHSSDDQSTASEVKQDECKEVSIPASSNSREEGCMVQDQEGMQVQTDDKVPSEQVKAVQMQGKKSDKQMPSNWSYLKKVIILRRFVKSLEKVRNIKPRAIRHLPAEKDPEAEKVHLRHQNTEGRKNAEEWMLDHALRQVISTLAPSQKRKVALLVQAFETVIPVPEKGNDMRSNASAASSPKTSEQAYNEFSVHNENAPKEDGSDILASNALYPEMSSKDDGEQASKSHAAHQQTLETSPEPKERNLLCGSNEQPRCIAASDMKKEDAPPADNNNEEAVRISHEKLPANEEVSILDSEVCDGGAEFDSNKMDFESSDLINSADQSPIKPVVPAEVGASDRPNYKFFSSQSESSFAANVSKSERQKYTRLWYLIYKHMVSSSAAENGSQPLQNEADEEIRGDDAKKFPGENNANCQASFAAGQNAVENHTTASQHIECHNNEIIKLVEEAIDEIPLPEAQDDMPENQELPKKHHGGEEVEFISTASAKDTSGEAKDTALELRSTFSSEEKIQKSEDVSFEKEAKRETEEANKSKKRVQRNWSNLKKLILLRRFVKALEKVREFNPRGPQYLPLDPAPESEKVTLRHQNMEDRKNAEEWMLDYALQRVVAKLTPERRRRVNLLVEAFETVIPTIS